MVSCSFCHQKKMLQIETAPSAWILENKNNVPFLFFTHFPFCQMWPLEKNLITCGSHHMGASLVGQLVKNLPTRQTQVQFPGREDPLEKEMTTHTSSLAWRIPWTEGSGGLESMGSQESDTTWRPSHHHHHITLDSSTTQCLHLGMNVLWQHNF